MVERTQSQFLFKGAEHQEWQRLHNNHLKEQAAAKSGGSGGGGLGASPVGSIGSGGGGGGSRAGGGDVVGALAGGVAGAVSAVAEGVTAAAVGYVKTFSALGTKSGDMANYVVQRAAPLKAGITLGERLCNAGWKARMIFAVLCAIVGLAVGAASHEPILAVIAMLVGGGIGWVVPTLLGLALALTLYLTGLAIGVMAIAAVLAIRFVVVAALLH